MKLVLFSDRVDALEVNTQLINLIGKSQPTIGYISSCPDPSRQYYEQTKQYYARMEATVTPYVDLESGFDRSRIDRVFQSDAIHLSGGNIYQFYYWIIRRGLRQRLLDYARSGKAIVGVSAGAIIMTPDISYSQFCGDRNYINLQDKTGLGLVDFCFVPHAGDSKVDRNIVAQSRQDNSRVVVAADSDYLIVSGSEVRVYGQPKLLVSGKIMDIRAI